MPDNDEFRQIHLSWGIPNVSLDLALCQEVENAEMVDFPLAKPGCSVAHAMKKMSFAHNSGFKRRRAKISIKKVLETKPKLDEKIPISFYLAVG